MKSLRASPYNFDALEVDWNLTEFRLRTNLSFHFSHLTATIFPDPYQHIGDAVRKAPDRRLLPVTYVPLGTHATSINTHW